MEKFREGGASSLIEGDEPKHFDDARGRTANLAHLGIEALDILDQESPDHDTMWHVFVSLEGALAETAGPRGKIPGEDEAYGAYQKLGKSLGLTEGELKFDLDEDQHIRKRGRKK